jgi:hypothetical protein
MKTERFARTALAVLLSAALGGNALADMTDRPKVDVGDYSYAQRDALKDALGQELKAADDKIERIHDANPPETRTADGQRLIVDVQAKRAAAKEALEGLDDSKGAEAWEQAKEPAGQAFDDLRGSLDEACEELLPEKDE